MTMPEVIDFIDGYARTRWPRRCRTATSVLVAVRAGDGGFRVVTQRGQWRCRAVVLASGGHHLPNIPACASAPAEIATRECGVEGLPQSAATQQVHRLVSFDRRRIRRPACSWRTRLSPYGARGQARRGRTHPHAAHVSRLRHPALARCRRHPGSARVRC